MTPSDWDMVREGLLHERPSYAAGLAALDRLKAENERLRDALRDLTEAVDADLTYVQARLIGSSFVVPETTQRLCDELDRACAALQPKEEA